MRRAGLVSWAGSVCRDLGTSVKHNKNQLCDYISARLAAVPASRAENLPCNRDFLANTFSSLNLASEKNGSPEDRYFSFYIMHKGLSDHKAT